MLTFRDFPLLGGRMADCSGGAAFHRGSLLSSTSTKSASGLLLTLGEVMAGFGSLR